MACKSDKLELVKEVAARPGGVNLSAWGTCQLWTPLHVAAHHGSNRLVSYLLGRGAVRNSRDRAGRSPLQLAELAGHTNCAKMLLAHAARPTPSSSVSRPPSTARMSTTPPTRSRTTFKLYSRGIGLCPADHPELVALLSNRAQAPHANKAGRDHYVSEMSKNVIWVCPVVSAALANAVPRSTSRPRPSTWRCGTFSPRWSSIPATKRRCCGGRTATSTATPSAPWRTSTSFCTSLCRIDSSITLPLSQVHPEGG